MPHLVLEYTDNLSAPDMRVVLQALNNVLIATGLFPAADIKARAYCLQSAMHVVGDGSIMDGFAALRLHTRLADTEKKQAIAADLLAVLKQRITSPLPVQYSVDIIQIDPAVYSKDRIAI